jgi:predicted permease
MDNLWRDLRQGLRQLVKTPGFTAAAILTLTLGIGATSAMFTVVNAVLLDELPYEDPDRLVVLNGTFEENGEVNEWPVSLVDFWDWRQMNGVFEEMSVFGNFAFNREGAQESERIEGEMVSAEYFEMLGVEPALGRFFTAEEDATLYEHFVTVLGYDLWKRSFGGDSGVLGTDLNLNGKLYRIVGVAPQAFQGLTDKAELWVPSTLPPIPGYHQVRRLRGLGAAARLKPGVTVEQAQQDLDRITAALAEEYPTENRGIGVEIQRLQDFWFGKLRLGLAILTVGSGIILLIACINVANLLLTRSVTEQRAYAIRMALGANRWRLIRQLLTEGVLLSLLGAALGLILATWATRALVSVSGVEFQSFIRITPAPEVIAAILGVAVLCGAAFGLAPMWITFRADLTDCLSRESKQAPRGKGWRWVQNGVVVAQVALVLVLSVSAGLMARGFQKLIGDDLGFRPENVLTFRLDPRGPKYVNDREVARMIQEYERRLKEVPGVAQLAMENPRIPTDGWAIAYLTIQEHDNPDSADGSYVATMHSVTPDYFRLLGIPIVQGRAFDHHDTETDVVIVSQRLAETHWPGEDPVGKILKQGSRTNTEKPWLTVVGVAADVQHEGLLAEERPAPDMYLSLLHFPLRLPLTLNFLVRPEPGVSAESLMATLEKVAREVNPDLAVYDVMMLQERLARQTDKARFQIVLITLFTVLALVLAAVGIYGVVAYNVSQRTREIAIRMFLGADRGRILAMVVGRGALLAGAGLLLGLAAVLRVGRLLEQVLYETSPTDPAILGGTALLLFAVALAANYFPARRAAKLEPVVGLRTE